MDNGLTFRFTAADMIDLVRDLKPDSEDHVKITYYFNPLPDQDKAYIECRAEAFKQSAKEESPAILGEPKQGCPVPPCA